MMTVGEVQTALDQGARVVVMLPLFEDGRESIADVTATVRAAMEQAPDPDFSTRLEPVDDYPGANLVFPDFALGGGAWIDTEEDGR